MSQDDNRNSSAAKRARTDGGRREDDWTCPSCGNVNFSFRTTCNKRKCTQPRPADHNTQKSAPRPQNYTSSAPYLGSGVNPSVYMGAPPYGAALFNGSSVAPYEFSFSGGSPYHFSYDGRLSSGGPYSPYRPPMNMSGPASFPGGSMMGNGGMYGIPPPMNRYGMPIIPAAAAGGMPRPEFYPDENFQKNEVTRDNDWNCPKCGNVNFSFRTVCNMRKCNTPKPGSQADDSEKSSKQKTPEGSWKCENCNNINYPFRTKCNRQNCGADRPAESNESPSAEEQDNDQ